MFNDRSTPLSLLTTRRSGKPRELVSPGPSEEELRTILSVGMRTPDHGKLAPWRFVIVPKDKRDAFGGPDEKVAGFIYLGTPGAEQSERPRPDYDDIVSVWAG